ncbi:hypothetical protein KFL_003560160 [Klebsormidium nitens]|uniref:DUF1664 domain-containing protein n=1 Tax=Klebsormidium nitens TaxID=105231 RepID=A0A1Y1IDH1_KLENI|nr:hypothetical protein KFL_003560160 [Klebsormidium nitens]|eukprot:GAQ87489.1 hypothetical protein KFL_003560160 [Klebsormidium nitens]
MAGMVASQAGMGVTKLVTLVVGAGLGGAYVLGNKSVGSLFSDLSKVLTRHLAPSSDSELGDGDGAGRGIDAATAALTAQVRRLSQEMRQLAAATGSRVTVVSTREQKGTLVSLAVPIAVAGAGVYVYMYFKGVTLADFMYVTKKSLDGAVVNMQKRLDQFTASLVAHKRDMAGRLDKVNRIQEEGAVIQGQIKDQVDEMSGKVLRVGQDIEAVQRIVRGLEYKLEEVTDKQDFSNRGIMYLCSFVTEGIEGRQPRQETIQGLRALRLDRSASMPMGNGQSLSLKGLQLLSNGVGNVAASNAASGASTTTSSPADSPHTTLQGNGRSGYG